MDENAAKKIVDSVFKDVFGKDNPFALEEVLKIFAYDIQLPQKVKNTEDDGYTWGVFKKGDKVTSQAGLIAKSAKDEFMSPKKELKSMDDVLKVWDNLNVKTGEKYLESKEVEQSDGAYSSYGVFRSQLTFGSQNIVFCYNNTNSKNLVGSSDNNACVSCIRIEESGYSSLSYNVYWSSKVSRSMFINDCFDMYECLFCSHLRSKKYCIGNMQYTEEEYRKIKGMVVDWAIQEMKKALKK
ncbi:MAG: hypothetical protein M1504_01640 [Candidatus Marsarchaeota archaeon]|nr:hypothetical protein [Candidatus Marsarchaeota archaeon]